MDIQEKLNQIDALVSQGQMVKAVTDFFANNAKTSDTGDAKTASRDQMVEKMEAFGGAIANVNKIEHHYSILTGNVSASEFIFDFDMKDGSHILWHEIIRRVWNEEGKVIEEQYFKA